MTPQLHEDLGCTLPDYRALERATNQLGGLGDPAGGVVH